jgi:hypothetical protein
MAASLRKSQAACDACPAPPPDPQKKSRPPRARVSATTSTMRSTSAVDTCSKIRIVSATNRRQ